MTPASLFPSQKYEFRLGLRRGDATAYFARTAQAGPILAERRRWFAEGPAHYLALLPAGEPLVTELAEVLAGCGPPPMASEIFETHHALTRLRLLSEQFEPDLVLLAPSATGEMEVLGGAVCFPSHWRLTDKLGHPMRAVHGPVPGLNEALGTQIGAALGKVRPETAWLRDNWSLGATAELNQHPDRHLPRLDTAARLASTWLRIERQALIALPKTNGILFGIRIEMERLDLLQARAPEEACQLADALQTMPPAVAEYKGLAAARETLIQQLATPAGQSLAPPRPCVPPAGASASDRGGFIS